MQAVWILLGKTKYAATFIQSSVEQGVQAIDIPFDIAAEYLLDSANPSLQSLADLAAGEVAIDAAFDDILTQNKKEDLFYRVAVGVLNLPPLRERAGDLRLLTDKLLWQINDLSSAEKDKKLSAGARKVILRHPWRGNVRELNSTLLRANLWSGSERITDKDIEAALFYSKSSLQFQVRQRLEKKPFATVSPKPDILTDRLYQHEALKRICECYEDKQRNALAVQATGTGKTRLAIALSDVCMQAGWAKRILFLCDRREFRKQARNAYAQFLNAPTSVLSSASADDTANQVFVATYPAMMKIFEKFDPGFFDLVIADESHRSIYNIYGDLFRYFDALQLGLTATPVEMVSRSTCQLFGCDFKQPTSIYDLDRAIEEGYLVPYEVVKHTTKFLRDGIKGHALTAEQVAELEDKGIDPNTLDFDGIEIDRAIYNKALIDLFDSEPVLLKIHHGKAVTEKELAALNALLHTHHPDVDLNTLKGFYGSAAPMEQILRTIVGLDEETVNARFAEFVQAYPKLNAKQVQFLGMLKRQIAKSGSIELETLYEMPFAALGDPDSLFDSDEQIDTLLHIVTSFGHQPHSSTL